MNVLLENALMQERRLGVSKNPLSALVLHLGEGGRPCTAAYQGVISDTFRSLHPSAVATPVVIYCSPSSVNTMRAVYQDLTENGNVQILPLMLDKREIDAESLLAMMAVDESSKSTPLYIIVLLVSV